VALGKIEVAFDGYQEILAYACAMAVVRARRYYVVTAATHDKAQTYITLSLEQHYACAHLRRPLAGVMKESKNAKPPLLLSGIPDPASTGDPQLVANFYSVDPILPTTGMHLQ